MNDQYAHSEAYCLMTYRSDDGTEEEVIWNSRDGVTPFVITLRSGKPATHVDWHRDRRVPDHRPKPGERIFVDLTLDRAREAVRRQIDRMGAAFAEDAPSVDELASEFMQPGAPDLIEADG